MRNSTVLWMYFGMLLFDLAVLAGTAFLIADRGWSAWWMLFAFLMCAGSNPRYLIRAIQHANITTSKEIK